jgi:hypothetical protein
MLHYLRPDNISLDTRALRPGVSSFLVQQRRDTEARKADAAIQVLHSRLRRSFRMTFVAPRFCAARLSWRGGDARRSIQPSALSSQPNPEPKITCFRKDPSTSLRISLGGSDAARTAQDVLFRN